MATNTHLEPIHEEVAGLRKRAEACEEMARASTDEVRIARLCGKADGYRSSALLTEAALAAAWWDRFLVDVRALGGDPILAVDLVRRNMVDSSDGASRETILGRLSLGASMTGEDSLERKRRAKC